MREYIVCFTFWIIFTILLCMLGRTVTKGKKSGAYALTTGYLVYSFLIAVGGMVTQFINLPWVSFAGYLVAVWGVLVGYILYKQRKNSAGGFRINVGQYIKDNWVIYVILGVLVGMLFFYYKSFWLGNHLDDGYYITKVATLPYTHTGYETNYSVGVANAGFDAYILNTWELEASVYVKFLGVKPTLYLRLFQSVFYYYLFLNMVKAFVENILGKLKFDVKTQLLQYPVVITLLFGIYYIFLSETSLLPLVDMFQFNSGMFLGSTMTKMSGMLLLLFYYLDADKLTWKMVMGVTSISIVLLSKSTIVLPIILVVASAYLVTCLFFNYNKGGKLFAVAFICVYIAIAVVLPGVSKTQGWVYSEVWKALHSPIIIICLIIFLCSFWLREKAVNRINCVMILSAVFMWMPEVNDIFELSSGYTFVAVRASMTWMYTFMVLNSIYLCAILVKCGIKEKNIKIGYIGLQAILVFVCIFGFIYSGDTLMPGSPMKETDIKNSLKVILNNRYFIPNSTILLGEKLEQLSKETEEQLYVVSSEWVNIDQTPHGMAVMLRTYAPDIISVSATARYPVNNGSPLESYDQNVYAQFVAEPSEENGLAFEKEIDKVGVNCIVVQDEKCSEWLNDMGYELYSITEDGIYYIWYCS